MDAGKLTALISFQKQIEGNDGLGGFTPGSGPWVEQFRAWGRSVVLRGGEAVVAAKTLGQVTRQMQVRKDRDTVLVDNSWRIVILNESVPLPMNVSAAVDMTNGGKWITVTAAQGTGE